MGVCVTYAMVCLEVVDVFAEDEGPEVFAEEFDDVEGVVEAGAVAGESEESWRLAYVVLCCRFD